LKTLKNKIAIVTGASSGIGKAIALRFAHDGLHVVVAARRKDLLQRTVDHIIENGGQASPIVTDIAKETQVQHLFEQTVQKVGTPDIVVNNAGIGGGTYVEKMDTEEFDRVINTNLRGTFFCCRAALQAMKQNGGTIINISSVCGVDAWAGTGAYSASKYGIMGLSKAMADEARAHNIKVSAICPGGVAANLVDQPEQTIIDSGQISPYDIAETAVYLARLGPNTIVHQIVVDRLHAEW